MYMRRIFSVILGLLLLQMASPPARAGYGIIYASLNWKRTSVDRQVQLQVRIGVGTGEFPADVFVVGELADPSSGIYSLFASAPYPPEICVDSGDETFYQLSLADLDWRIVAKNSQVGGENWVIAEPKDPIYKTYGPNNVYPANLRVWYRDFNLANRALELMTVYSDIVPGAPPNTGGAIFDIPPIVIAHPTPPYGIWQHDFASASPQPQELGPQKYFRLATVSEAGTCSGVSGVRCQSGFFVGGAPCTAPGVGIGWDQDGDFAAKIRVDTSLLNQPSGVFNTAQFVNVDNSNPTLGPLRTAIDFLIKVSPNDFDSISYSDGPVVPIIATAGKPVLFRVFASDEAADIIRLTSTVLPAGASTEPSLPTEIGGDEGVQAVFHWVPSLSQTGAHAFTLVTSDATDGERYENQALFPVTILVNRLRLLAGGYSHSIGVRGSDSALFTWGRNNMGQLGLGEVGHQVTPVQVTPFTGEIADIDGGESLTLVLKKNGTVWACGLNHVGQLGQGYTGNPIKTLVQVKQDANNFLTAVTTISAGRYHCLALKNDGTVVAWGINGSGRLGNNSTQNSGYPVQVITSPGVPLNQIASVKAGGEFSVALAKNSTVYVWGENGHGQLGTGSATDSWMAIPNLELYNARFPNAIAAGSYHTMFLENGVVFTCGLNLHGQLGIGSRTHLINIQLINI